MRVMVIASMAALLAAPAFAQGVKGVPRSMSAKEQQALVDKRRQAIEAEKSGRAAIEKLPDKPFDPWRNSRGDSGTTSSGAGKR